MKEKIELAILPNYSPRTIEVKQGGVILGYVEQRDGILGAHFIGITLYELELPKTGFLRLAVRKVVKASFKLN